MNVLTRSLLLATFCLTLTACSSKPSESQMKSVIQDGTEEVLEFTSQMMGVGVDSKDLKLSEVIEVGKFELINGVKEGENKYIADVKYNYRFKKSVSDYSGDQRKLFEGAFGNFTKDQETPLTKVHLTFVKGDKGWMLQDK